MKSRKHLKRRKKAIASNIQIVLSEPSKIFAERYLTKTGTKVFMTAKKSETKEVWNKYGKNRYKKNSNSTPIRVIKHYA